MKRLVISMLLLAGLLFTAVAVYAQADGIIERFDVTPNPMDRDCTIILSFRNPMNITLQIQTAEGAIVKDIYSGYAGKNAVYTWDRINNNNQYVASGSYMVVVSYDTRYTSTKKTLILK